MTFNSVSKDYEILVDQFVLPMGRGSGPCRNAKMIFYLLQDVNHDDLLDIGLVNESIRCDFENDVPSKPYFQQDPVKWHINDRNVQLNE